MNFKKRLLSVVIIIAMLVTMLYYGAESIRQEEQSKTESYNNVETIKVWYSDDALTEFFTNAAVLFHEKNPDIRVVPELVSSSEYLEYINEVSLSNEGYPDVFLVSNDMLEKSYLAGLSSKTNDVLHVLNENHYSQTALDAVTYHDSYVAYPLYFETSILVYNKTYLEDWADKVNSGEVVSDHEDDVEEGTATNNEPTEPLTVESLIPESFDEVCTFADSYNAPEGVEGVLKWDVSDIFYNYFFVGNYMNVGGATGDDSSTVDIYNADTIKCLEVYQNLNQFFSIDPDTAKYESVLSEFLDGKSVFTIVTSDAVETIRNHEEEAKTLAKEALDRANKADAQAGIEAQESHPGDESDKKSDSDDEEEEISPERKEANELQAKVYEFGFARIPMVSDSLLSRSLSVTSCLTVNSFSKKKDAANKFAAFAATQCSNQLYTRAHKVAASTDAKYDDADLALLQEEYANSVPLPKIVEVSNFWVQLEIAFTKLWRGEDIQTHLQSLAIQIIKEIGEQSSE